MKKWFMMLMCVGLLGAILAPAIRASEFDRKTIFTFSGPVEIPGKVLPAGTYVFTLLDSVGSRNIVQIWTKDQTRLLGTYLTINDERLKPAEKPIITYDERPSGSPEAIHAWFYPGYPDGQEFVYPKSRAKTLAAQVNEPVLSMPEQPGSNLGTQAASASEPEVQAMEQAPVTSVQPSGEEQEVLVAQAIAPPMPTATTPKTLPKTGSNLSLIALVGILCLASGSALHFAVARSK